MSRTMTMPKITPQDTADVFAGSGALDYPVGDGRPPGSLRP